MNSDPRHDGLTSKLYVSANIVVPGFLPYVQKRAKEAAHNGCDSTLLLQNRCLAIGKETGNGESVCSKGETYRIDFIGRVEVEDLDVMREA